MPGRGRRRGGIGVGERRRDGLGEPPAIGTVTPQQVVEDARDTVFTLLDGASLEGLPTGIVEGARDAMKTLLTGSIAEV